MEMWQNGFFSWLTGMRQHVVINGESSSWGNVGSLLGPLLFFIYMNDIDTDLFSKICKFADDTKIGHAVATEDEVRLLRDDLKNLAKWAIDWQMLFNVQKCVVMHIGTNNKLYSYNMNNATLKIVDVERDLGVIINKNGKYLEQCLMAAKKGNCVLGMMKRNIKCKNASIIMRLYKFLVRPSLEYCIQTWSPDHKKDIEVQERVQKMATKMVYGCEDLNYKDRLSLLELSSLEKRRVRGDLIEVFKLLKGIAKMNYSIFFKLSVVSKVRRHTYKIVKNSFRLDVRKNFFSNRVFGCME